MWHVAVWSTVQHVISIELSVQARADFCRRDFHPPQLNKRTSRIHIDRR